MRPDIILARQDLICAFAAVLLRIQDFALAAIKQHDPVTATAEEKVNIQHLRNIGVGSTVLVVALSRSPERVCVYDPNVLPDCDLRTHYRLTLLALSQELLEWDDYVNKVKPQPWVINDFDDHKPRNQSEAVLRANITELVNLFDVYNNVSQ